MARPAFGASRLIGGRGVSRGLKVSPQTWVALRRYVASAREAGMAVTWDEALRLLLRGDTARRVMRAGRARGVGSPQLTPIDGIPPRGHDRRAGSSAPSMARERVGRS